MEKPLYTSVIRLFTLCGVCFSLSCAGQKILNPNDEAKYLARFFADRCMQKISVGKIKFSQIQKLWKQYHTRIYYFPAEIMLENNSLVNINPGSYSCSLEVKENNALKQIDIWPFTNEVLKFLKPEFKDYEGHKGPSYYPSAFIGRGKGAFYYDADGSNLKYIWSRRTTSKHYQNIDLSSAISFEMIVYPNEQGTPKNIIAKRRLAKDYERRLSFLKVRENRIWYHERNRFISKKLKKFVDNNAKRATNSFLIWSKKFIASTGTQKFPKRFSLRKSPVKEICQHYNGYWYYQTYRCDFDITKLILPKQ